MLFHKCTLIENIKILPKLIARIESDFHFYLSLKRKTSTNSRRIYLSLVTLLCLTVCIMHLYGNFPADATQENLNTNSCDHAVYKLLS